MKRVLLVTYGFPPMSTVQAQGAGKLARGLAERGWEVHALTVADPPTFRFDPLLAEAMPTNVITHTAFSLEPTRVLQALRRAFRRPGAHVPATGGTTSGGPSPEATTAAPRSYTALPQSLVNFVRALFFPEEKVGWRPWARREALRLHSELRFDAVISTGPPYTDHLVAMDFSRRAGVPWLAVLMDPIVGCYAFPPATPVHSWLFKRLERAVARHASAIAVATPRWIEELSQRNPTVHGKTLLFPNSFDPAAFQGPPPGPHAGFTVAYVGTFQLSVRPDDLLDATVKLRQDPEIAADLRLRFVAPLDPDTTAAIESRALTDFVERTGLVSHADAVTEMRAANVLVLILGPEEASRGILTGKLPEYLAAGVPILAIAPQGVATNAVQDAHAGLCVEPGDVAGIERALRQLHAEWRSGTPRQPDPEHVSRYDRTRTIASLDETLNAILKRHPTGGTGRED